MKRDLGFTLIEIMLGMTLLSIMMALLFATMRISAQSWDAGEGKIAQVSESAVVYNFFQRHLSTARPLWNDFSEAEPSFSFQGHGQSMQFVSAFPASAGRAGLQLFSIELLQQGGDGVIKVALTPFFPSAENEQWRPEQVILLRNVRVFKLAYLAPDESNGSAQWQDEWVDKEAMPGLVKISIARNNETFWPEMVFAPRISAEASVKSERQPRGFN